MTFYLNGKKILQVNVDHPCINGRWKLVLNHELGLRSVGIKTDALVSKINVERRISIAEACNAFAYYRI